MALASIAVPADSKRDARALALVDSVPTWPLYTLKVAHGAFEAGTVFRRAYGSNGARYLVNAVACGCPDYQERGAICKHIRAVVLWEARQAEQPAPVPSLMSYRDLYPACAAGCGDLVERKGERCYACLSNDTRRQEMAARREMVTSR